MLLVYRGTEAVIVPDARLTVAPGAPTQIPDDIAASLLERPDWRKAPKQKEG